ncbi:FAD dependent oxidoreductase [Prosthecobacter fusiformis]|uniref:FAD dependent oxidoreductase n=1 Tax=Prosthecobacter fusiformis TaxID=48464 RepID=A0A4R7RPC6_9BACT|nr:FAD-dependent oxidoreductase [Prosthecobacter fusiformis]TDU67282.1 FAD dependent oxidoreductase [Prosthecobacter fusiformis]
MHRTFYILAALAFSIFHSQVAAVPVQAVDVCIYAGTPAGINAAIAARQEGRSVLLVEPSRWVGGILGAGIKPKQDCPIIRAVGGLTQSKVFNFSLSPETLRTDFQQWLKDEQVPVIYGHRLQSLEREGGRIVRLHLEDAPPDETGIPQAAGKHEVSQIIEAKVFIDASYEGDVMAAAGVAYSVGREAHETYGEAPAGVGLPTNWTPLDPYIRPGDPASGLLPLVDADHGRAKGAGDEYTQAYNYRFYVTDDPAKRVPLTPPADYEAAQYEVVGRFVEYLVKTHAQDAKKLQASLSMIFPGWRNQGEYNYQRQSLITMAPLGLSRYYQDGDYTARARVWKQHQDYLRGLHHFMSTDARVPEKFRAYTASLGLDKTKHEETNGWPNQLYVRLTRRMDGPYRLTHADVLNTTQVSDSVGLALYGVDIYPVRRYAAKNPETGELGIATEGNMFIGGAKGTGHPYAIPYRAITPKVEQCSNLLVPVCISASYIAYASARMEPVFCILGESAGVAAAQAIDAGETVQAIDVAKLQKRLLERGQILEWTAEK